VLAKDHFPMVSVDLWPLPGERSGPYHAINWLRVLQMLLTSYII